MNGQYRHTYIHTQAYKCAHTAIHDFDTKNNKPEKELTNLTTSYTVL